MQAFVARNKLSQKLWGLHNPKTNNCRSRRPCGLRRWSAAAGLLGLWVRIPLGACLSVVSVVCCQVEVSTTGHSLFQKSPTKCGMSEGDREAWIIRRPWPTEWLLHHGGGGGRKIINTNVQTESPTGTALLTTTFFFELYKPLTH
jgi:hypothetical protein